MADDRGDLAVVDAALHHRDQRGRQPDLLQRLQRRLADTRQPRTAQIEQRLVVERIELEIDLEPRRIARQPFDEGPILRDPHPVGVDHHVADRAALHRVEDREELGMDRGFAARELDEIGLAFARHQRIEHRLDLGERTVAAVHVGGVREAHRAGEVARLVDLDDRQAAVLFVIGAQPAIERAPRLGAGLRDQRPVAGLDPQLLLPPIVEIVADERPAHAMLAATLEVEDAAILDDDLGGNGLEAGLAQARRLAVEDIGRGLALGRLSRPGQDRRVATRQCHTRSAPSSAGGRRRTARRSSDRVSRTPRRSVAQHRR